MEVIYVNLVNRTSKNLTGRYDGRQHTIPAGSTTSWPEAVATKFRDQNPLMGSENYYTGDKQFLLGIVENGDPTEPLEQSDAVTLWQFNQIPAAPGSKGVEVAKGHGFNPMKDRQAGLPSASPGFEANNLPANAPKAEVISIESAAGGFEKP